MTRITTIIATNDRPADLQRTLCSLAETERRGIAVNVAVVENGAARNLHAMLDDTSINIDVIPLSQKVQGKNHALNKALEQVQLGDYLHFTDDDVSVPIDLYQQIVRIGGEYPQFSVFGGRIHIEWPPKPVPEWAAFMAKSGGAFPQMDLGDHFIEFPSEVTPLGPNFWIRRSVLLDVPSFDTTIGPGLSRRTMGSETSFILAAQAKNHRVLYCPTVDVGHHIQAELLEPLQFTRRAFASGRGSARLRHMKHGDSMFEPFLPITIRRRVSLLRWAAVYCLSYVRFRRTQRMHMRWKAAKGIGWNDEALQLMREIRPRQSVAGNLSRSGRRR